MEFETRINWIKLKLKIILNPIVSNTAQICTQHQHITLQYS
jgi:hypothetical protein